MSSISSFSARMVQAMQKQQITQAELCAKTGISRSTMSQYCSGAFHPKKEKLIPIAKALHVSAAWLMGYEADKDEANSPSFQLEDYPNLKPIERKRFPILGEIACGKPILAQEDHGEFVIADAGIHADFCLIAHGDSMIGARIYDGDVVFIHSQPVVDNGEIAAVIIDDEATLKRVYFDRANKRLQLVAENPAFAPLVYVGEELEYIRIIGKAVAFMSCI